MKRLLIIQVAGLGSAFVEANGIADVCGIKVQSADGLFPGLTCSVQAAFRTAQDVSGHGMPGNGYFDRKLRRAYFWEQSSALVDGSRIWESFSKAGGKTAMLFWQQSMGESVDFVVSPAPVHKHHGGIIENTYSKPRDLYSRLASKVGRGFKLRDYWGPLASVKASKWIADATAAMIKDAALCPDLCMTYLPALDYDLQRYGPNSGKARSAARALHGQLEKLVLAARDAGMDVLFFGDYSIAEVNGAVLPNLALAETGLLKTNRIRGMLYPDLHESRAFCVADHEIGHVYVPHTRDIAEVRNVLVSMPGIASVMDRSEQRAKGIHCDRAGDLIAVADERKWIAYPWWRGNSGAPEYAGHVDIHNKPGYDPCELFFGWPPVRTSMDTSRINGSHGKAGAGREVAWGSTVDLRTGGGSLLSVASAAAGLLGFGDL